MGKGQTQRYQLKKLTRFGYEQDRQGTSFEWPTPEQFEFEPNASLVQMEFRSHSYLGQVRVTLSNGVQSPWLGA